MPITKKQNKSQSSNSLYEQVYKIIESNLGILEQKAFDNHLEILQRNQENVLKEGISSLEALYEAKSPLGILEQKVFDNQLEVLLKTHESALKNAIIVLETVYKAKSPEVKMGFVHFDRYMGPQDFRCSLDSNYEKIKVFKNLLNDKKLLADLESYAVNNYESKFNGVSEESLSLSDITEYSDLLVLNTEASEDDIAEYANMILDDSSLKPFGAKPAGTDWMVGCYFRIKNNYNKRGKEEIMGIYLKLNGLLMIDSSIVEEGFKNMANELEPIFEEYFQKVERIYELGEYYSANRTEIQRLSDVIVSDVSPISECVKVVQY